MDSPIVKSFLAGVGALVLSVYLLDVLKGIYARFFRAGIKLTKLGSYGNAGFFLMLFVCLLTILIFDI